MIWGVFVGLTLATLAALLFPLFRSRPQAEARGQYDIAVYKDQLAELDRELEQGTMAPAQAEAARVEIQRRILAVTGLTAQSPVPPRLGLAALICVGLVIVAGFGLYLRLGHPDLPDQPYAARADKIKEMQDQVAKIQGMVASLAARLEKTPNDGPGWAMLGRSLRVMGEKDRAIDAYRRAAALIPGDVQLRLEYAQLLLADLPDGAPLPAEFMGVIREIIAVDPNNPQGLFFQGLFAAQNGDTDQARSRWTKLLSVLPDGSEEQMNIRRQIEALGK